MKFLRLGSKGNEKPAILDKDGKFIVKDRLGKVITSLSPSGAKKFLDSLLNENLRLSNNFLLIFSRSLRRRSSKLTKLIKSLITVYQRG